MDIYTEVLQLWSSTTEVESWPDLLPVLEQRAAQRPEHWKLPLVACQAVGGQPEQALPGVSALAALQTSILLVDDLLDGDGRSEGLGLSQGQAANLAAGLQALGLQIIARCPAPQEIRLAVLETLNTMLLQTARGQALDAQNPQDEAVYWQIARAKSSPFFASGLFCGAALGGATLETANALRQFGEVYGEIVQIQDDLHDTLQTPASADWLEGRAPLPILFAQTVTHPERQRFLDLRRAIPDPAALAEAQAILVRCGAVSYGLHQSMLRYEASRAQLEQLSLANPQPLLDLLEQIAQPIRHLLQQCS